jgi:hypothetical protein
MEVPDSVWRVAGNPGALLTNQALRIVDLLILERLEGVSGDVSDVSWDVTPYSLVRRDRCYKGPVEDYGISGVEPSGSAIREFRGTGYEDRTGSGSCPVAGSAISGVES